VTSTTFWGSSRSGPANLAEGFWRYRPRENARFVRIALGSLGETVNHLHDGFTEKYIEEEYRELDALARRALKTAIAWHNYLENCPDKPPTDRVRRRKNGKNEPDRDQRNSDGSTKPRNQNQEPNREPTTHNENGELKTSKHKT
jgi:four helix bundle protein